MDSRVTSVDQIVPYLFLTGLSGVTDDNIRNYSIKLVVNTASEIPRKDFTGVVTQKLDFYDIPTQNVSSYLDYVADLIHSYVNSSQSVLVHCYMGISRSSTMVLAYLIKYKNMSFIDALAFCKSRRSIVSPNSGFIKQLQEFEKRFNFSTQSNYSTPTYTDSNSSYSSYYENKNYNSTQSNDYNKSNSNDGYTRVQSETSYYSNYPSFSSYSSSSSKNNTNIEIDYTSFNNFYNSNYYNQNSVSYAY